MEMVNEHSEATDPDFLEPEKIIRWVIQKAYQKAYTSGQIQ